MNIIIILYDKNLSINYIINNFMGATSSQSSEDYQ